MSFVFTKWIEILDHNTHLLLHLQKPSEALNSYIWFRKVLALLF